MSEVNITETNIPEKYIPETKLLTQTRLRQKLLQRVEKKTMGGVPLVAHDLPVESIVAGLNGSGIHLDSLVPHQRECEV
jgi:hypothetical protein